MVWKCQYMPNCQPIEPIFGDTGLQKKSNLNCLAAKMIIFIAIYKLKLPSAGAYRLTAVGAIHCL